MEYQQTNMIDMLHVEAAMSVERSHQKYGNVTGVAIRLVDETVIEIFYKTTKERDRWLRQIRYAVEDAELLESRRQDMAMPSPRALPVLSHQNVLRAGMQPSVSSSLRFGQDSPKMTMLDVMPVGHIHVEEYNDDDDLSPGMSRQQSTDTIHNNGIIPERIRAPMLGHVNMQGSVGQVASPRATDMLRAGIVPQPYDLLRVEPHKPKKRSGVSVFPPTPIDLSAMTEQSARERLLALVADVGATVVDSTVVGVVVSKGHEFPEGAEIPKEQLQEGDIVVKVGNIPVPNLDDYNYVCEDIFPGEEMAFEVMRGSRLITVTIRFGAAGVTNREVMALRGLAGAAWVTQQEERLRDKRILASTKRLRRMGSSVY